MFFLFFSCLLVFTLQDINLCEDINLTHCILIFIYYTYYYYESLIGHMSLFFFFTHHS